MGFNIDPNPKISQNIFPALMLLSTNQTESEQLTRLLEN